ncbi:hypothetical protein SAMD00019534_029190 [Acytostelium subglobosum LB1]|uniref:hypothetical protein n=1 Tax=Acytostelium subglobosum LB1 TaxID=1410327 RepID=UPI0006449040|nr:hypothetical protein SAMD00019534_029190 [Acytostelium subglobosum LB1]GAM19744.1 hypothetical protein SAMD00019534_029190 [Acytostelium subglobosum LB1]|eukprot:XP_012756506.1 hypothetical protein SAMD00019534_029190 [Acytostelium subglobosum LB1]
MGDVINLGAGKVFAGKLVLSASGTSDNPITLQSASDTNPATIDGGNQNSGYVVAVTGSYWIVRNLKITNGQKGIMD